jgi:hypothetical protein
MRGLPAANRPAASASVMSSKATAASVVRMETTSDEEEMLRGELSACDSPVTESAFASAAAAEAMDAQGRATPNSADQSNGDVECVAKASAAEAAAASAGAHESLQQQRHRLQQLFQHQQQPQAHDRDQQDAALRVRITWV